MEKEILKLKSKVYKITLGTFDKNGEYYNYDSIKVKAGDVRDALNKAEDWILSEEEETRKAKQGIFVESVELLETIDLE